MADTAYASSGPAPSAPSASYNKLINAISTGAIVAIRQHITEEPELVNVFGWHRQTALHRACLHGNLEVVKLLLDAGADPNARNNFDETPLHYACKRGIPPVISYMLEKNGNVSLVDKMGKGVVHHAAEAGSVAALHLLELLYPDLKFSIQDNNLHSPLHSVIKAGKMDVFKYLIKKGRSNLKCSDRDGNWPIHLSAQEGSGHMTWSQLCILGLPALHAVNKHCCTPYDLASMYDTPGHRELLSELEWQRGRADRSDVKQRAYLFWFFYLLQPILSYGAAIIVTRFMPSYHSLVFFPVVVYNVIVLKNSMHRMNHVSRWPQPAHAGAFAAGLFHTILAYLVVILPYMGSHPYLKLLSFVLIVLIAVLYVKLVTKNPGFVSNSAQDEKTGRTLTFLDICHSEQWTTFCFDCEIVQAKFTKHCKLCERCVMGLDHHCLFLLRCIARDNHCLFLWFLLLCALCMTMYVYAVFLYVSDVYASLALLEILMKMITVDSWVFTMFLLNCVSVVWCWTLIVFQLSMISSGYTQYYQPKVFHGTALTSHEKLLNIIYFMLNRSPHLSNRNLYIKEEAEVV